MFVYVSATQVGPITVHNVSGLQRRVASPLSCSGTEQRRLAFAGQRGTREEIKRRGREKQRGGQGMENVKRNVFMGGGV